MYKEYKPHQSLRRYIETYWVANGFVSEKEVHRILPDGCVDIIFSLNSTSASGRMLPFIPYVVGTMTTFSEITYLGEIKMLGIRFRPGAITSFTRVPIIEFTDSTIDIPSIETILDIHFYQVIQEKENIEDILLYVDNYLLGRLSHLHLQDQRIEYGVSLIQQANGNISVSDLASKLCMSKRQMERKFISDIGVSPKTFCKIIQFRNTLHFIRSLSHASLFDIAIDCGYYDHSHLIKDFRRFSGSLPSQL